ncbi:MAG TPA: hypothetical protein VMY99_02070 [Nevskiaceae bacterium]|nr:hypothetical protein [Nevskiaceae bacterium]
MVNYETSANELCTQWHAEIPGMQPNTVPELLVAFEGLSSRRHDALLATQLNDTGRGKARGGYHEVEEQFRDDYPHIAPKSVFYFDPNYRERWTGLSQEITDFIDMADAVYGDATRNIRGVFSVLDSQPTHSGLVDTTFPQVTQGGIECNARLVLARYGIPELKDTREVFETHRDSLLSAAVLGETVQGFYFADAEGQPEHYDLRSRSVVFVGRRWEKMYPTSPIKAIPHGVRPPDNTPAQVRTSAILFIDPVPYWDRSL